MYWRGAALCSTASCTGSAYSGTFGSTRGSEAMSGLTVIAKFATESSPMRATASVIGMRMRCSSMPRVRSFGTSRYRVPASTPFGSTRFRNPWSCGVMRGSSARSPSTDDQRSSTGSAGIVMSRSSPGVVSCVRCRTRVRPAGSDMPWRPRRPHSGPGRRRRFVGGSGGFVDASLPRRFPQGCPQCCPRPPRAVRQEYFPVVPAIGADRSHHCKGPDRVPPNGSCPQCGEWARGAPDPAATARPLRAGFDLLAAVTYR